MTVQRVVRGAAFVVVASTALFAPFIASAVDPTVDARCWPQAQQAKCGTLQGYFDEADLHNGGSPECGQGWFQCFSGNKPIDIAIKIGGVGEVKNLGEYIRLIYTWLIPVGAILAVVVIMIGGIIWLTSGGADRLSTAKQWIGNAIVGLLLLVFSYVILSTINPDLVRLTLPRTQILRRIVIGAQFCVDLGEDVEVHQGSSEGTRVTPEQYTCGKELYPVGTTTKTCQGSVCPPKNTCATTDGQSYSCVRGSFSGVVTTDGLAYLDDGVRFRGVCVDGRTWIAFKEVNARDVTPNHKQQAFVFPIVESFWEYLWNFGVGSIPCVPGSPTEAQRRAAIKGFALEIEVDDEGADEWFALERTSCGGSAQPIITGDESDPDDLDWKQVQAGKLFSIDEFDAMVAGGASSAPCALGIAKDVFDR